MNNIAPVPVVAFVASRSGSGKTTLLEKVIIELTRRNYRVATMKHVKDVHFDIPGKDSWRHRQAGALAVGLVGGEETLITGPGCAEDPLKMIPYLPPVDLVLMEGFKQAGVPKVQVIRAGVGEQNILPFGDILAVATDIPGFAAGIPCFPLDDAVPIVDWLVKTFLSPIKPLEQTALSHFDSSGRARMVDVSGKPATNREAMARGEVYMAPETLNLIREGRMAKGDVLAVAQVAAIMAVKETPRLIPMCHPLNIAGVSAEFNLNQAERKVEIEVRVKLAGQTGVEMEALTGVCVAALTIYDMCKAVDKSMVIGRVRLVEKSGGRLGHFRREE